MKRFLESLLRSKGFWLGAIVVVQTLVYLWMGISKAYIHMDEAYSLALVQYDKVEIQANEDFYDHWHSREYFQDYLAIQEDERWDLTPVYENQRNDVHPPLYYFLLRLVMEAGSLVTGGEYSKWPGIILNTLIAGVNTVLIFGIIEILLVRKAAERKNRKELGRNEVIVALGITMAVALTNATIGSVVYIRMYELLTMFVLLTTWLSLRILSRKQQKTNSIWLGLGVVALMGVLTQYYYLFFLGPMWICVTVRLGQRKRWKEWRIYTLVLAVAGVISLIIWPYSIQHMFFGYRGQGVLASLLDMLGWMGRIWRYVLVVDYEVFHRTLLVFVIGFVIGVVGLWRKNGKQDADVAYRDNGQVGKSGLASVVLWSTLSYFLVVAAVSPFIELRYIMPICGLILMMVVLGVGKVWQGAGWSRKRTTTVIGGMLIVMILASPLQIMLGSMRIELLYRDKEALMQELTENAEVPALYMITTENNRFLDNILPFATFKESYLALDMEPNVKQIKEIMAGKDTSNGLYLFVSDKMDLEQTLQAVVEATGLEDVRWVRGVNTCEIYYLSNLAT